MSVIKVRFDRERNAGSNSQEYAYFCDYPVEVGDRVIVDSPYNGLVAVTVSDTSAGLDSIRATKEVVCLIDASRYNARKVAKARLVEIGAELDRRAAEKVKTKHLRKLFKKDKKAKSLLNEAEGLAHVLNDKPGAFLESKLEQMGFEVIEVDQKAMEEILRT